MFSLKFLPQNAHSINVITAPSKSFLDSAATNSINVH